MERLIKLFLRAALASSFLSAVADRFGVWGPAGKPGVVWGNYEAFLAYTAQVNSFLPAKLSSTLGLAATAAEIILSFLLMIGLRLRETALASGALLLLFAVAMCLSFGPKPPLDYSVFTASAAAFALAALASQKRG